MSSSMIEPGHAPPERPRVLLMGTALSLIPVLMAFAGLFGIYLHQRAAELAVSGDWLDDQIIPLTQPNMMAITWVFSAFTIQMAVWSLARRDRSMGLLGLLLTMVLGLAVLNQTSLLVSTMELDKATPVGILVPAIVYAHALMTLAGLVFILLVSFRVLAGQYLEHPEGVAAAALYWYVTGGVYSVIWFAIYVTK